MMRNVQGKRIGRKATPANSRESALPMERNSSLSGYMPELTNEVLRRRSNAQRQSISEVVDSDASEEHPKSKDSEKDLLRDIGLLNGDQIACLRAEGNQLDQQAYEREYRTAFELEQHKIDGHCRAVLEVREVTVMDRLERLPENNLKECMLKKARLTLKKISLGCEIAADSSIFKSVALLIILVNTAVMVMADPLARQPSPTEDTLERFFLGFYLTEMAIKIAGSGFVLNKDAYLRNYWNLLDFVVVLTSVLPLLTASITGLNIASLKAIRVIRPLRAITKINSLKMILKTLFASLPLVLDSIILLALVIAAFAILGVQLFGYELNKYCMDVGTGITTNLLCRNDSNCVQWMGLNGDVMLCARTYYSPNFSIESFDGFGWSIANVFQIITMEGWSTIMYDLEKTTGVAAFFFCVSLILICSMTLFNITLAILKDKFGEQKKQKHDTAIEPSKLFSIETLKRLKLFAGLSKLNSNIHKRMSIHYGAGIQRKRFLAQQQHFKKQPPKHRRGFKSSIHILVDKNPRMSLLAGSITDNEEPPAEQGSVFVDPSAKYFAGIKTTKSIRSMKSVRDLRSAHLLPSAKALQFVEYPINEVIYRNAVSPMSNERKTGQNLSIIESDGSESSIEQIQTEKAMEEGQNYNFENIQVVERNKFLFELMRTQRKETPQNQQASASIRKKLEALVLPKIIDQPSRPIFNELDLFKTARGFCQWKVPVSQKKPGIQSNSHDVHGESTKEKNPQQNRETLEQMKHEQQIAIEDMKTINEARSKQLEIVLSDNYEPVSQLNTLAIARILREDYKPAQTQAAHDNPSTRCKISYRQQFDEHERLRLDNRIMKLPEPQLARFDNGVSNSSKQSYGQLLESAKQLTVKKVKDSVNELPQFRIRFEASSLQIPDHSIEPFVNASEVYEKYFQPEESMGLPTPQKKTACNIYREPGQTTAIYEELVADDSIDTPNKIQLYDRVVEQIRAKEVLLMRSPADDVMATSLVLPSELLEVSEQHYSIWIGGCSGLLEILRNRIRKLVMHEFYDTVIFTLVVLNTILLCLNGLVDTSNDPIDYMSQLNYIFTMAFLTDVTLKLLAYDFDFFDDYMNIFDLVVVIGGVVELNQSGNANFTAFKSVKLLKALRVLRITRLIRGLKFMNVITNIIVNVVGEFVQIFLLLGLFMLIYVLLGMQVFGGNSLPIQISGIRQNFNSFFESLVTVFQVLTVENWNDIQTLVILSSSSNITLVYLVTWIIIGNWVLLNLLQAVLLDGFDLEDVYQQGLHQPNRISDDPTHSSPENTEFGSIPSHHTKLTQLLPRSNCKVTLPRPTQHYSHPNDNYSLFIFSSNNKIRKWCRWITEDKYFEWVIFTMILVSCGKLIFDTYDLPQTLGSSIVDYTISILFLLEFLMKIISKGFITGSGCYIEDRENKLDFFIILSTIADLLVQVDLRFLKILRVLRPLRMISRHSKLKVIIQSLGESIAGLANVSLLLFLVFLIFGILFVSLLQGKLNYCDTGGGPAYGPYNITVNNCSQSGGKWRTQQVNFDNVYRALLSMFILSTRQNWPYYYYTFVDADDQGPTFNNNPVLFFILMVLVILICSYFLLDLFVGVLFTNYRQSEARNNPRRLTQKQQAWVVLQKLIVEKDPQLKNYILPANPVKRILWRMVTSVWYRCLAETITVLNVIVYAIYQKEMQLSERSIITKTEHAFYVFFSFELLVKIIVYGPKDYLSEIKNINDLIALLATFVNLAVHSSILTIVVVIARIWRVISLLRLLKTFKALQRLIDMVVGALPSLANVLMVLGLFICIFAVLASYIFGGLNKDTYGYITEQRNFSNFHQSLRLLFVCLTGENWYYYMFVTMHPESRCVDPLTQADYQCGSPLAVIFWLPFIFIGQKIVLQLFVLVVLEQFERSYIHENNPIGLFESFREDFTEKWVRCCKKDLTKQTMTPNEIVELCLVLKPPLGLGKDQAIDEFKAELARSSESEADDLKKLHSFLSKQRQAAVRLVRNLELPERVLQYHQVFYYFTKKALKICSEILTQQQEQIIKEAELESETLLLQQYTLRFGEPTSKSVNPLIERLFNQIALSTWCRYTETKNQKCSKLNRGVFGALNNEIIEDSILLSNSGSSDEEQLKLVELRDQKRANIQKRGRISRMSRVSRLQALLPRDHAIPNTEIYGNLSCFP